MIGHMAPEAWRKTSHNSHPLDPRGDGTVSRIVGRRETESIRKAEDAVDAAIEELARRFTLKLSKNPKLARADLEELAALADARIAGSGLALHLTRTGDLKRASSPRAGTAFVSLSARSIRERADGRYEGAATVNLDVMTLERGALRLLHIPLGIEWRQHVADRFHLRSGERGDAHAALGSALGPCSGTLDLLTRLSADEDVRLNVPAPVADGLVVGMPGLEGGEQPVRVMEAVEGRKGGLSNVASELYMPGTAFHPTRQPTGWTGVTYKSGDMVGAAGRAYAEGFRALDEDVRAWKDRVEDVVDPGPAEAAEREAIIARGRELLERARRSGASRREDFSLPQPATVRPTSDPIGHGRHHLAFRRGYVAASQIIQNSPGSRHLQRVDGRDGIVGRILRKEMARR